MGGPSEAKKDARLKEAWPWEGKEENTNEKEGHRRE